MELTVNEKEAIFTDLMINTFMTNPQLYDKCDKNYIYTPEKIQLLKKLSNYLKDEFNIIKSSMYCFFS